MATIGLRDLYRAPITTGSDGKETYGTPVKMAKAISAELTVEAAEAILYADDGADEVVKEFVKGEIKLGVNDLLPADLAALWGRRRTATTWFTLPATTKRRTSQSASAQGRRAERINTFGFTKSNFPFRTKPTTRRATGSNFPRRKSSGSSSSATTACGRRNTFPSRRTTLQRLGLRQYVNRTRTRHNKTEYRKGAKAGSRTGLPALLLYERN